VVAVAKALSYIDAMQIRKLTLDDTDAFREIRIEMCRLHPEAFAQTAEEVASMSDEQCREWWAPSDVFPEKFVLGAFEGERLLATAAFRREEMLKERHRAYVWSVYARPEARGKGLAKQLMQAIIAEARTMDGLEIIQLVVSLPQTAARTLYTSLGFFTTGLILSGYKLPDGNYVDHEEMTLRL
jgi:ribosomal protein S18 acetylase RimI-like enzyme